MAGMAPPFEPLPLERVAVFGSTRLTLRLLECLEDLARPRLVLGLAPAALAQKANGVDLAKYCAERSIAHSVDDDWTLVVEQLQRLGVETVITVGDSRVGRHGSAR
jgi:hypothetical protein